MRKFTDLDYKKVLQLKEKLGTWKKLSQRTGIPERTLYRWQKKKKNNQEVKVIGKNEDRLKRTRNIYQYEFRTKPKKQKKSQYPNIINNYASLQQIKNNLSNALSLQELLKKNKENIPEDQIFVYSWFAQFKFDVIDTDGKMIKKNSIRRINLLFNSEIIGISLNSFEQRFEFLINQAIEEMEEYVYYENGMIKQSPRLMFIWANTAIKKFKGSNRPV